MKDRHSAPVALATNLISSAIAKNTGTTPTLKNGNALNAVPIKQMSVSAFHCMMTVTMFAGSTLVSDALNAGSWVASLTGRSVTVRRFN